MVAALLDRLGVDPKLYQQGEHAVHTPIDGSVIARVQLEGRAEVERKIALAAEAFQAWRKVRGAPGRAGAPVRRAAAPAQGRAWRAGVLGGRQDHPGRPGRSAGDDRHLRLRRRPVAPALRPDHRLRAPRAPHARGLAALGVVGIISAFNFPVAVWSWNAALALVCGNPVVWKPSEKTPLTALACQALFERVAKQFDGAPRTSARC